MQKRKKPRFQAFSPRRARGCVSRRAHHCDLAGTATRLGDWAIGRMLERGPVRCGPETVDRGPKNRHAILAS